MEDFEKLGTLYLGREYDLATKESRGALLYDSKDMVTHGVCVGMTGSGKTGLCIAFLEEAALDGIPAIVIDPKGDLANLLLTFPELRADDFRPWIGGDEAARRGLSIDEFAQQQAETWKKGLAEWGQAPERIKRLRDGADFAIYTPGSNAGLPVSILRSFSAPTEAIREDDEALGDRIHTAVSGLLGLVGIEADPIQSREHILLSTLLHSAWSSGRDLDLTGLIRQVQAPPFATVGVLDLEAFYPQKERFGLAMLLNNLLAAPSFKDWLEGEPLDIGRMLVTPEGRPRVSIFSIAHLPDAERMFFVSLLLNEVLGWMRSQQGTGSLRALLYMDEIFGYFPPVAEPPSKKPLLTLLKQARAFGLGVLLATQNPVDLDYKGLANAGTWFIGRLQTERDKDRLLEGLEGVASDSATKFDRQEMGETLAGLGKRIFLMYNVHEDAPVVFQTRWTMSYLAGPLTRAQVKTLVDPRRPEQPTSSAPPSMAPAPEIKSEKAGEVLDATRTTGQLPQPPAEVTQFFLPLRGAVDPRERIIYKPGVLASASVNFVSTSSGAGTTIKVRRIAPVGNESFGIDWDSASPFESPIEDLERKAVAESVLLPLPTAMLKIGSYRDWERDFAAWLFRTQSLATFRSAGFKLSSNPGEQEGEFRSRLQLAAREKRDSLTDRLRKKYATKTASLQQQILRAEHAVEREQEQAKGRKMQTAISFGATLFGAFMGRKLVSSGTMGRATTAMRDVGRTIDEQGDIKRAEETLAALQQKMKDLEAQFQEEVQALDVGNDPLTDELETVLARPRKSDIAVDLLALVWSPYREGPSGSLTEAWH